MKWLVAALALTVLALAALVLDWQVPDWQVPCPKQEQAPTP